MIHGQAHKYGDNIDTDVIIPARHCLMFTPEELAPHCLEDLDSEFASRVREGDLLVAGSNFGCGSSRENAPLAIKGAGVACVIARSFARIFFRNAINIGLPILECPEAVDGISSGDAVQVDLGTGVITNLASGQSFEAVPFPPEVRRLIEVGGMVEFVKQRLEEREPAEGV